MEPIKLILIIMLIVILADVVVKLVEINTSYKFTSRVIDGVIKEHGKQIADKIAGTFLENTVMKVKEVNSGKNTRTNKIKETGEADNKKPARD